MTLMQKNKMRTAIQMALLIFILVACKKNSGNNVQSSIVYGEIKPDDTITLGADSMSTSIDLNKDGISDFKFFNGYYVFTPAAACTQYPGHVNSAFVRPLDSNQVFDFRLDSAAMIDSNLAISNLSYTWDTATLLLYSCRTDPDPFHSCVYVTTNNGYFWVTAPAYIGIRIYADQHAYYGWIRINFNDDLSKFAILDYAYNKNPGESILAGQTK
jgi:hypothetical protein